MLPTFKFTRRPSLLQVSSAALRPLIFILLSLWFGLSGLMAQQRSREAAQRIAQHLYDSLRLTSSQRVRSGTPERVILQPVVLPRRRGAQETSGYFLFAPQQGEQPGFVVIAEDERWPSLLGYSVESPLDVNNLPPALLGWLEGIAQAKRNGAIVQGVNSTSRSATRGGIDNLVIAPLLNRIQWGQSAPYNNYCPTTSAGKKAPVGCVATAMAQIMRYHQWPDRSQGEINYQSVDEGKTVQTISVALGKESYNWAKMPVQNADKGTPEEQDAVARLSYDAAVSVKMQFQSQGSSSGSIAAYEAFVRNFKYSQQIQYLQRSYCSAQQWNDRLIAELTQERPFFISGVTATRAGHAFVCDGYDGKGLFHINWGWQGMANGYFSMLDLQPAEQGIGGASDGGGYNFDLTAVIGIIPDRNGSSAASLSVTVDSMAYNSTDNRINLYHLRFIRANNEQPLTVYTYIGLIDDNGNQVARNGSGIKVDPSNNIVFYGLALQKDRKEAPVAYDALFTVPKRPAAGKYRVALLITTDNELKPPFLEVPLYNACPPLYVTVDSNGRVIDATQADSKVQLSAELKGSDTLVDRVNNRLIIRVTNYGKTTYNGFLGALLTGSNTYPSTSLQSSDSPNVYSTLASIDPGQSQDVVIQCKPNASVTQLTTQYIHLFYDPSNSEKLLSGAPSPTSYMGSEAVKLFPTISAPFVTPIAVVNNPPNEVQYKGTLRFSVTLQQPNSGGFVGNVRGFIMKDNKEYGNSVGQFAKAESVILLPGQKKRMDFNIPIDLLERGIYSIQMAYHTQDLPAYEPLFTRENSTNYNDATGFTFVVAGEYIPPQPVDPATIDPFAATPVAQDEITEKIRIYPNPNRGIVNFALPSDMHAEGSVTLSLYDSQGREVRGVTYPISTYTSPYEVSWDVTGVAPGLYILRVTGNRGCRYGKVAISR